jgi:hypothetical protein
MKKINKFSAKVCDDLGHYVYRLIDPRRDNETFYVGRGTRNRLYDHVNSYKPARDETPQSAKISRIIDIHESGNQVQYIIHRHKIPKSAHAEVEAAVIDAFPNLTNDKGGDGSNSRGPMTDKEIKWKYELPEFTQINTKTEILFISINSFSGDTENVDEVYSQARFAWRVAVSRANICKYVVAVYRDVIVGVFENCQWKPATDPEFEKFGVTLENRAAFVGERAIESVWSDFVGEDGKLLKIEGFKFNQNPIRYLSPN